jgi:hypothetical protein
MSTTVESIRSFRGWQGASPGLWPYSTAVRACDVRNNEIKRSQRDGENDYIASFVSWGVDKAMCGTKMSSR